jgi:hypothetical protein
MKKVGFAIKKHKPNTKHVADAGQPEFAFWLLATCDLSIFFFI